MISFSFTLYLYSQEDKFVVDSIKTEPVNSFIVYINPLVYDMSYIFELQPEFSEIDNKKDLKLWIPVPREWDSQKEVNIVSINPKPDQEYIDSEYGNKFLYWDFGQHSEKSVYRVEIRVRLTAYEIKSSIKPSKIKQYNKNTEEYEFYTSSSNTINITPKVEALAKESILEEKNPYLQAKRIYEFVKNNVHFKILDLERGRGTTCLLEFPVLDKETGKEHYEGCCSQMSALFIAMCRSIGIPARSVFGFIGPKVYKKEEELKKPVFDFEKKLSPAGFAGAQHYGVMGGHMWAEFYLQDIGWIPVDANASLFGEIFGMKVIMSKGRDIQLGSNAPKTYHEGYGSQWVPINEGRVDFPLYAVWNIGNIHNARVKIIHHPLEEND